MPVGAAATAEAAEAAAAANAPSHWFAGTLRLLRGSVEVFATRVLRAKPLEVATPTAVVGVRGTRYRVGVDLDADAEARTHGKVLDGLVQFDVASAGATPGGAALRTGFGAAANARSRSPVVACLLAAPDLSVLPALFERPIVRFALPGTETPLRVQVAADAGFDRVVSDQPFAAGAEVRLVGLDDAPWFVRARRIDAQGIEGFDATRPFVLKARPEPPAYRTPRSGAKQAVGAVEFAWAAAGGRIRAGPRIQAARGERRGQRLSLAAADAHDLRPPLLPLPQRRSRWLRQPLQRHACDRRAARLVGPGAVAAAAVPAALTCRRRDAWAA